MRELLEFVLSLASALLFAGLTVGGTILLGCTATAGGCYWGWKQWKRRARRKLARRD